MSIVIQSEDLDSGSVYDGTWKMSDNFIGNYTLNYIYFDKGDQVIPWIWDGVDKIRYYSSDWVADTLVYQPRTCNLNGPSIGQLTTTSDIQNAIRVAFYDSMPQPEQEDWTIDCVYQPDQLAYLLSFKFTPASLDFPKWAAIKIVWDDVHSTASGIFDKTGTQEVTELRNQDTAYFYLPASHVGDNDPKYVLFKIDEAATRIIGSCANTNGTFIVSTAGIPFTGQSCSFIDYTNELNISIYRTNIPNNVLPLNAIWSMILTRS